MTEGDRQNSTTKVLYLVAHEEITSPLLTRQVTELLVRETALSNGTLKIKILLFQNLTSLLRRRSKLLSLKRKLAEQGVGLSIIPAFVPWPIPNFRLVKTDVGYRPDNTWNRWAARFFSGYALPFLAYHKLRFRADIVHSRSYPAALAAQLLQKAFSRLKHVFDPRSDFPEENVTAGRWHGNSGDFKFWKASETKLLQSGAVVACISPEYVEHFERTAGKFPHFIAPNNVDTSRFNFDQEFREAARKELGWFSDDRVFVYLGGMSTSGWHRPGFYRRFIELIRAQDPQAKLLMLVPPHANGLVKATFADVEGVAIRNPAFDKVASWLSVGDFGLIFMHRCKLAVGTKVGEYLSVGLPVICNSNCLGTLRFMAENPGAGCIVDIGLGDDDHAVDHSSIYGIDKLSGDRNVLHALSQRVFDNDAVAKAYLEAYRTALVREAISNSQCESS